MWPDGSIHSIRPTVDLLLSLGYMKDIPEDIKEKVARLKASSHFDTINEGSARYIEKQEILLALCGKKPVSEAVTCRYVNDPDGRHSVPDDETQVAALLDSLGLAYHIWSDEYATMAVVSLDSALVKRYVDSIGHGHTNIGLLFGYPKTAVDAFQTKHALTLSEHDARMAAAGLPEFMPQFVMSRAYADDEIKVLRDWHDTIVAYGFDHD